MEVFGSAFALLYCGSNGRPGKPIRLMVDFLVIKHRRNISDKNLLEQWSGNIYYQYFCGETSFMPCAPCEASELMHFRNRIGESSIELILKESIRVNRADNKDDKVKIDNTVQETRSIHRDP